MVSPQAANKLFANLAIKSYWKDGNYSTLSDIDEWVDMRDFSNFAAILTAGNLTGAGVVDLKIYADQDSDGGDSNILIADWTGSVGTAEGDQIVLECTAEQIAQEGADNSKELRYVSAYIQLANSGDEAVVTYVRGGARFPQDGLTADSIT